MFRTDIKKDCDFTVSEFRHDLLLNFSEENLFKGTNRNRSGVFIQLPYPVLQPKNDFKDSVKQLLEEKKTYLKLLNSKQKNFKHAEKNITTQYIAGTKFMYLPKHLLQFYQEKDPDPYFDCDYNYYYTGGILHHLSINDSSFLLCPNGNNRLNLLNLEDTSEPILLNFQTETPIYNLNSVKDNGHNALVIREKRKVSVVQLDDEQNVSLWWSDQSTVPLLDAKLNNLKTSHFGTISCNGTINIRDIETHLLIYNLKVDNIDCDNFQQFNFINENQIVLMNRFKVKVIDYRTNKIEDTFDTKLIKCNFLCNFTVLDNTMLLTSRHYVLKTDLRFFKNMTHYSHSLSTPPCYMDFTSKNGDTYLCVGGQDCGSKVLFTGKSCFSLPYPVPSILNTLKECQLTNSKFVFKANLDERLGSSCTGLKILNLDDDVYIFFTNSIGEIFKQKVSDTVLDTRNPIKFLNNWINQLQEPEPVLHVTHVEEMSKAKFALNTPLKNNLTTRSQESKAEEFLNEFASRYKKNNVQSLLAKDFISVWDSGSDDDDDEINDLPEIPNNDKVEGWIQQHDF